MYNMDISIGSYKVRLEIFILIVALFFIMFGHALCSCSTMSLSEGFEGDNKDKKTNLQIAFQNKEGLTKRNNMPRRMEGFSNLSTSAFDTQFAANNSPDYYMNPNDWAQQTLVYTPGTTPSADVQSIWDRSKYQKPPAKGQLSFFDNIKFAPECCPSDASSSMGCACYTVGNYNTLKTRGGNNVPYSDL